MKAPMVRTIVILTFWLALPLTPTIAQSEDSQLTAITPAQLDSVVAPIALYPDPLLSQVLVASTYPLEIIEAVQWLQQNSGLSTPALQNAATQQNWDPSVQALVLIPDALHLLSDNIQWTTTLGNLFLAQQNDVLDAVQRLRAQAVSSGVLTTNAEEIVSTEDYGSGTALEIEPANSQMIYVPMYEPMVIWGTPIYPYPIIRRGRMPIIVQAGGVSFAPSESIGYAFTGWMGWDSWGWQPNWFDRTIVLNSAFVQRFEPERFGGTSNPVPLNGAETIAWVHDPTHRGNVPYPVRRSVQSRQVDSGPPGSNSAQRAVRSLVSISAPVQRPLPAPVVSLPAPVTPGIRRAPADYGAVQSHPPVPKSASAPKPTPPALHPGSTPAPPTEPERAPRGAHPSHGGSNHN